MEKIFVTNIENIKDTIQDSNLNFLIGSGLSVPFFGTLGNIENWLTELEELNNVDENKKIFLKASIYKSYFDVSMKENALIRDFELKSKSYVEEAKSIEDKLQNTYLSYFNFLSLINHIIYERRSNTVTKQVNLFTTNIDVFLERTIEDLGLQYNDGFNGVFKRKFSLSNFKRSYFQKSLHYDNVSELPVFNLLKVHGSVSWKKVEGEIIFDNLTQIEEILGVSEDLIFLDIKKNNDESWKKNKRGITLQELYDLIPETYDISLLNSFLEIYEKLQIVNPSKNKFKDTTFNRNYYEMLRLYSNELEKEATSLFVMGFSMADEHIREITIRAINSNPTLTVFICTFLADGADIIQNFNNDGFDIGKSMNVKLIHLQENFDLRKINEFLFQVVIDQIKEKSGK